MISLNRIKKLEKKSRSNIRGKVIRYDQQVEDINEVMQNDGIFTIYVPIKNKDN